MQPGGHQRGNPLLDLSVSSAGSEAMQPSFEVVAETVRFLSVSSAGSEAMQQEEARQTVLAVALTFSILGRIGGDATKSRCWICPMQSIAFSILGRIGGDATTGIDYCEIYSVYDFQYPRSDRRRCNNGQGGVLWLSQRSLSVSSVGSEAMQRKTGRACTHPRT